MVSVLRSHTAGMPKGGTGDRPMCDCSTGAEGTETGEGECLRFMATAGTETAWRSTGAQAS